MSGAGISGWRWALVVALLLLVNVPFASSLATDRSVERDGEQVTAEVVDAREQGDEMVVALRFDADVDPSRRSWPTPVERPTYDEAREAGRLEVTAVPGEPGAFEVPGERRSATGVWMTLLGNLLIAGWVALMLRRARRLAAEPDEAPGPDVGPDPGEDPGPAR